MFVTRTCRPIKFGFVVNPGDTAAIQTAVEMNSFLWGGQFNPIIPLYKRKPMNWSDLRIQEFDRQAVFQGYLKAFDPDYVVPVGDIQLPEDGIGCRKQLRLQDVLGDAVKYGAPSFGLGIFEVLDHFEATELRYVRSRPIQFRLPTFARRHSLFLSAFFGALEPSLLQIFKHRYDTRFGIEYPKSDLSNYIGFLQPDNCFLSRTSSLFLKSDHYPSFGHETCLFLCDPSKPSDILDYWNLRAIGWKIFPVPLDTAMEIQIRNYVSNIVEHTFAPYRHNPQFYARTTLLKSRSCTDQTAQEFVESLGLSPTKEDEPLKIVIQRWYPRIWDEAYWQTDHVICCSVFAGQSESEHSDNSEDLLRCEVSAPVCIDDLSSQIGPRFANSISVRSYSSRSLIAEVMPECDGRMCDAIQSIDRRHWRFSDHGLVRLCRNPKDSVWMKPPDAQQTFLKWMEWQGWQVNQSSAGLLATQLLRSIGGIHGINILAQKRLLQMLNKMAGGSALHLDEVRSEFNRAVKEGHIWLGATNLLKSFVDIGVIRLGVNVQCPICSQRSWNSLSEIDYNVRCPRCEAMFALPTHNPDEIKWAYRAQGAFGLPKQAQGAYCVLLLARFFSQLMRLATTPILGCEAKRGDLAIEIDYGALTVYRTMMGERRTIIFAECKTFNHFETKDVNRMAAVAGAFQDAVLVFATLNDSLALEEKRSITTLAKKCRRKRKSERSGTEVLILTGNELFAESGTPYCWQDKKGVFEKYISQQDLDGDLKALCSATQEIYLG